MDLKEIWSKISKEAEQAAAIADIMCVFSIVSGSTSTDLPLESIPNGMIFIHDTIETHSKNLSEILKQLTDYIKNRRYRQMGDLIEVYAIFDQIATVATLCTECGKTEKDADDVLYAIKTLVNAGYSKLQAVEAANRNTVAE